MDSGYGYMVIWVTSCRYIWTVVMDTWLYGLQHVGTFRQWLWTHGYVVIWVTVCRYIWTVVMDTWLCGYGRQHVGTFGQWLWIHGYVVIWVTACRNTNILVIKILFTK